MAKHMIPEHIIEEVRAANDIVDVIGEYIQLKKQGKNYFGLCPFHGEKTPSFSVTQEKQIFHCFGCGKGGNAVTFLMEMESYSFYEAIEQLANRAGKQLPENTIKKEASNLSHENQQMLEAHEWLTKLYHHLLRYTKDGKEGYRYFADRGIGDEAIDTFQLGFAPHIKGFTAEFLEKKGFHLQGLLKNGLVSMLDDQTTIDRFGGRVIFPIRNHLGKTVAFGGRSLGKQEPKYLNSPETELFQKGKLFYNFDLAKRYIRKESEAILFEGYMDVITAYQAGIKNVIATLGTSLTEIQAKLLNRYVDTVILCYDDDAAGMEAAYKAAVLLRKTGCSVKIAKLKDNMDPDDFIKTYGKDVFEKEVIKASDTFMAFYMRYVKKDYNLSLEADRIHYIEKILQQLAAISSSVEREYYVKDLSNEFDVSVESLMEELEVIRKKTGYQKKSRNKQVLHNNAVSYYKNEKLLPAFHNAERKLLQCMLQNTMIADKAREEIGANFTIDEHKIIATHLYAFYEEGHLPDVSMFIDHLNNDGIKQLVIEIAMNMDDKEISDREINDYIRLIQNESSDRPSIQSLKEKQRLAEKQDDPIKAAEIAVQIMEMKKQLK
ncbi:DNA primase [Virgibacillus sp. YIM 98842]|uniref:DNA primase n=1 Tax=Virgibacillus sp. YIM 98842 TaxID=2663533 RepID=UPI0013DC2D13|nr:DNA primase [Virgibacillus sp. YIM 98842]